ncbi:MAG: penicillin-binding transpeptidase domain-containing protein [Acidobacteriaceae bacterium]
MSRKPKQALSAPIPRLRFVTLIGILLVWAVMIAARLVWLQVFRHAEYAGREFRQQDHTFQIAPRRGMLYDRDLQPLAMTVLVDSIYAVPGEIADKDSTAQQLARIVHVDPSDRYTTAKDIDGRLHRSRDFAWVARKVDADVAARVRGLNLKGVYFQKEFKRYYPDNDLAAQVLGYVSLDDNGLGGVEHRFDGALHGTAGQMLTAVDAHRHSYGSVEKEPTPGQNMVLTLDAKIQFMAEQALDHAMERTKALNGTVVVQDPHTGQILALAIRPTFNPNNIHEIRPAMLLNHAVSDVYEPGSTFKLVPFSAALQEKIVTPESMIPTFGGQINVAGRIVHDDRDAIIYENHHGNMLSVRQALAESSQVVAIQLAERLGKDRFYQYIHAYGFGQKSEIELPGETRGLLKPPNRWQATTIGSIPMGQEVGVTPIQLVTMASTIANGGVYLPPHIVLEKTSAQKGSPRLVPAAFHPEDTVPDTLPAGAHRVISTMTAAEMRSMMEGVVMSGTGTTAQLNGYSAAGKTGTAQKIDVRTRTYSKTKYIASFVGFAPVNNPAITVAVIIDSPTVGSHFGRAASAPVFQELAQQVLEYLGVPHDMPIKPPKLIAEQKKTANDDLDGDREQVGDLDAMFAEVNHLPKDDPLRAPPAKSQATAADADEARAYLQSASDAPSSMSAQSQETEREATASPPAAVHADEPLSARGKSISATHVQPSSADSAPAVTRGSGAPVAMPGFIGKPMRDVVVTAANLGLNVRVYGSGVASEQAPAAGTKVPAGTTVVVRFHP